MKRRRRIVSMWLLCGVAVSGGCQDKSQSRTAQQASSSQSSKLADQNANQPSAVNAKRPEDFIREAEQRIARRNPDGARAVLKQLLIQVPDHSVGLFLLARLEAEDSRLTEAIALLEAIPAADPNLGLGAMGQRADYLSQLKRYDESIPLWKQMLDVDSQLAAVVKSRLADDLYAAGQRWDAGRVLQSLCDQGQANEDHLRKLLNLTRWPKSRDERIRDSRKGPTGASAKATQTSSADNAELSEPLALLDRVWDHVNQQQFREAAEVLRTFVKARPDAQAWSLLAMCESAVQQFDAAQRALQRSGTEGETYPAYWLAVGDIWGSQGKADVAVAAYFNALTLDPTWELSHERLVGALLKLGETDAARRVDERKFALAGPQEAFLAIGPGQPDDLRASRDMVADLQRLGRKSQAIRWMELVASRHPQEFGNAASLQDLQVQRKNWSNDKQRKQLLADLKLPAAKDPAPTFLQSLPNDASEIIADTSPSTSIERQPVLMDVAAAVGVNVTYLNRPQPATRLLRLHESLGSGVAAFDFDLNGDVDLYFGQASGDPPRVAGSLPNQVFRNLRGRYQDVTSAAGGGDLGYTTGVTSGDWNQDGWPDLVVGNLGTNRLYLNQGDGTFFDATEAVGYTRNTFTSSLGMGDANGDGLADIIEVRYAEDATIFDHLVVLPNGIAENYPGPNRFRSGLDSVWIAAPTGTAQEVALSRTDSGRMQDPQAVSGDQPENSQVPRIGDDANPGLGLIVTDLDGVPGLELFVANDARPNQLWRVSGQNAESIELNESAAVAGVATSSDGKTTACMGVALSDFDRDGRPDMLVTNWYDQWVNYYLQLSPGLFQDLAAKYSLDRYSDHHLGFGTQGIDFDNNGMVDVMIGNGHIDDFAHLNIPQRMSTQLLINLGNGFVEADMKGSGDYWKRPHIARCLITLDHNADGKLDAVMTDLVDPVAILENQTQTDCHFLQLQLVGVACERSAVGARVVITSKSPSLTAYATSGDGYLGKSESLLHFGLGQDNQPVDVEVTWPDGTKQAWTKLEPNARYLLVQGDEPFQLQ